MMSLAINSLWLTINTYMEARGESFVGKVAVCHVVMNRVIIRGLSVQEVIFERSQFSWVGDGKVDVVNDLGALEECAKAAATCISERSAGNILFGADHYFNPKKLGGRVPNWAKGMKPVAEIGDHHFYRSNAWKNVGML